MKNIIALVNSKNNAHDFITYTARLANDMGSKLLLIHILNPAVYPLSPGLTGISVSPVYNTLGVDKESAFDFLKKAVQKVSEEISPNISIDFSLEVGGADIVLNRIISETNAEMLAMEGNNLGGIGTWGTTNTDIALKVKSTSLIIPPGFKYLPFNNIIYATNYNEADIRTLKDLFTLTEIFSPEITALHITESPDFEEKTKRSGFMEMIKKEVGYKKIIINSLIDNEEGNIGEVINDFALSKKANLISVLKKNRGFIEKLFTSSSTKKIVQKAQLPVLIYQEKK